MSETAETTLFGAPPETTPKVVTPKMKGKPKKKARDLRRSFTKSDIKELEGLLNKLEAKTKVGKVEALMELAPMIIANIRKGWKPIEIAKVLKEDGRMASVRQTDILRTLRNCFDNGELTEADVQQHKLKAIFSVKMEEVVTPEQ
jgi:IS30 family transposase